MYRLPFLQRVCEKGRKLSLKIAKCFWFKALCFFCYVCYNLRQHNNALKETKMEPKYKRVLLKISGEALAGEQKFGINEAMVRKVAAQVKDIHDLGVEVAIVVGGGNFWRGRTSGDMDRATADYMGMLATVMNSLALQDGLLAAGVKARVQTAIEMREIAEPYARRKAISQLEQNDVVIFGAGTGSPFFSTDTASALRAAEIKADVLIKATKVDGVCDKDPKKYDDAVKYDEITYIDVINKKLNVIYCRVSTTKQKDDLIKQEQLLKDYCNSNGIFGAVRLR